MNMQATYQQLFIFKERGQAFCGKNRDLTLNSSLLDSLNRSLTVTETEYTYMCTTTCVCETYLR